MARTIFVDQIELLHEGTMILTADGDYMEIIEDCDGNIVTDGWFLARTSDGAVLELRINDISCILE